MRLIKRKSSEKEEKSSNAFNQNATPQIPSMAMERDVFLTVDENFAFIKGVLGDGIGLVDKKFIILKTKIQTGLIYIDSLTDKNIVSSQIIEPLLKEDGTLHYGNDELLEVLQKNTILAPNTRISCQMKDVFSGLMKGSTILFFNGTNKALIIESRATQNRPIEKPETEATSLGSLDSLTEDIDTNCNLINKRLPTPDLRIEKYTIGRLSETKVKLLWIDNVANSAAVDEVRKRIQKVDIDVLDGTGMLAELIRDRPLSVFPTFKQSQRPDVLAKSLSDGQFVVLCDCSPFGFIGPVSFWDHFKTLDDYSQNPVAASYLRIIRYLAYVISTTISPLYLAFVTYNHIIVPPDLATNIAKGRDAVPFPSLIEVILLTIIISIIREASLRIPGPTGYFIGTMSAIVIGQASVSAGYVSASVIIVISISVICSFAVSSTTLLYTTRLINYFLIFLAGAFGMFGVINGVVLIIWHMISLESFTVPYLYPLVPFDLNAFKDTLIRLPFSNLNKRFNLYTSKNKTRM